MKNTLIVFPGLQFHLDEGAKHRMISLAKTIKEFDNNIYILIFFSPSSLRFVFNRKKYLDKNFKWILFPSLTYSRSPVLYRLNTFINRVIAFLVVKRFNIETVHAEHALGGCILKYVKNRKIIIDIHGDSEAEAEFRHGKDSWQHNMAISNVKEALNRCTYCITVSEILKSYLELKIDKKLECEVLPCGVDVERFVHSSKSKDLQEMLTDKIVLGYVGGLQKWQKIEDILEIVISLRKTNKKIFFLLITNDDVSNIKLLLNNIGINKLDYYVKGVSRENIPSYVSLFDFGFLIREDHQLNRVSSPTKTGEYLAAGCPVICTKFSGDTPDLIEHGKTGFVLNNTIVQYDEIYKLNLFIQYVMNNKKTVTRACHVIANDKHSWKNAKEKIKRFYV